MADIIHSRFCPPYSHVIVTLCRPFQVNTNSFFLRFDYFFFKSKISFKSENSLNFIIKTFRIIGFLFLFFYQDQCFFFNLNLIFFVEITCLLKKNSLCEYRHIPRKLDICDNSLYNLPNVYLETSTNNPFPIYFVCFKNTFFYNLATPSNFTIPEVE